MSMLVTGSCVHAKDGVLCQCSGRGFVSMLRTGSCVHATFVHARDGVLCPC